MLLYTEENIQIISEELARRIIFEICYASLLPVIIISVSSSYQVRLYILKKTWVKTWVEQVQGYQSPGDIVVEEKPKNGAKDSLEI